MYKIRKIKFVDHPILKNLELNFCDASGNAVDTVILAGGNGTGKSTIIETLYNIANQTVDFPVNIEFEDNGKPFELSYYNKHNTGNKATVFVKDHYGLDTFQGSSAVHSKYPFNGIFSDVDINFHARDLSTVTSLSLDTNKESRRSSNNLPTEINQLIIDIQAMDDAELARDYRYAKNAGQSVDQICYLERMSRFTTAFSQMFEGLSYSRIENQSGKKSILFQKNGIDIPIDGLSSGEKQVVYRGCFLLRDVNATNGAFVFIDEPEISLHPNWQMKIMDYYKGIFTDKEDKQTSQIFAVTHSPFVIHNDTRKNDKVIILARDETGNIIVKDKPEYFKCNSVEAVKDAFSLKSFSAEQPTVYLEGRTDEKYFGRSVEVYGLSVPFRFKWVGYMDDRGQEANTGEKCVDAAFQFLVAQNLSVKNFCLKDCDTSRQVKQKNNVTVLSIPSYENSKGMRKGIENALVLDNVDLTPYYSTKTTTGDYGEEKQIQTFDKMACCDGICAMDSETLREVFANLKTTIDQLLALYNEE